MNAIEKFVFHVECSESAFDSYKEAEEYAKSNIWRDTMWRCAVCNITYGSKRSADLCCSVQCLKQKCETLAHVVATKKDYLLGAEEDLKEAQDALEKAIIANVKTYLEASDARDQG
jgi:hypothetical protein